MTAEVEVVLDTCPICGALDHPREQYLTASDIAKCLGVSRFGTTLDLYCEKRGLVVHDMSNKPWLEGGHYSEGGILDWYRDKQGVKDLGRQVWMTHPDYPWIGVHFDMVVRNSDGDEWPVEAKKVGMSVMKHWGDEGSDVVPADVLWQALTQAWIVGSHRTDVVAEFGGQWPPKIFPVVFDQELMDLALPTIEKFWKCVQDGNPPEPDFAAETTSKLLAALYPVQKDLAVTLPAQIKVGINNVDTYQLAQIYDAIGKEMERLKSIKTMISNRFKAEFRAQGGTLAEIDGMKVKLIETSPTFVPAHTKEGYDYVRFFWPKGTVNTLETAVLKRLEEAE